MIVQILHHDTDGVPVIQAICHIAECLPEIEDQAEAIADMRRWGSYTTGGGAAPLFELKPAKPLTTLTEEYQVWCKAQGLPDMSADELIAALCADESVERPAEVNAQIDWLMDFIDRWEAASPLWGWKDGVLVDEHATLEVAA
jgi:hypothetical protein